jgi:hypothetical protein
LIFSEAKCVHFNLEVTVQSIDRLCFRVKDKSFMQYVSLAQDKQEVVWEASREDWKDNIALIEALLKSGSGGHQYFGDSGTEIVVKISYRE